MGKAFLYGSGGGGAGLNFKVVGGITEPSGPKENTIWLSTPNEVTGYYFSTTQPEDPAEGNAWITTGTASPAEFNVLKKNSVRVYPVSAKQYIGGTWVGVTAKSYQGGKWVPWLKYLFNNGDECKDITGGWSGSWTNADGRLSVTASGSTTKYFQTTENKINLTDAKTLTLRYEVTKIDGLLQTSMRFGLMATKPSATANSLPSFAGVVICDETKQEALLTVDTPGEYYVVIMAPGATTTKTNVYEVIMD